MIVALRLRPPRQGTFDNSSRWHSFRKALVRLLAHVIYSRTTQAQALRVLAS